MGRPSKLKVMTLQEKIYVTRIAGILNSIDQVSASLGWHAFTITVFRLWSRYLIRRFYLFDLWIARLPSQVILIF